MIPPPFLAKLPWRAIGVGALVLVAWWQVAAWGSRREAEGRAAVQALWDADEAAELAEAQRQIADNAAREAEAARRNEGVLREYQSKVAAAERDRDRYVRLLRDARAAAHSRPAEADRAEPGTAPAGEAGGPEGAGGVAGIDLAIAAVLVEARLNADQLDALLAELKPQLVEP